jgi:hypothetical protein
VKGIIDLIDEQVDYVCNLKTSHAIWEYLHKIHEALDDMAKVFLFRTLINLQINQVKVMIALLKKGQRKLDTITSTRNNIDERTL